MIWVLLGLSVGVVCFSFVLLVGAPYLPTRKQQISQALELLQLKKGDTLLELGAGSGGLTFEAAKLGIKVKAYELNPLLALVLKFRANKYNGLVEVHMANFWTVNFADADGIYVFLLDRYMSRLDKKVKADCKHTKLVSYTFKIPSKKTSKILGPMYLYEY